MKILKEAKEDLPISFLTNLVSKGWDEVGILKEQKEAIKETFKGTKKVEDLIQGLIDAYLVCIGQTELLMKDKSYIEMPEEAEETKDETKDLSEDLLIKVTPLVDIDPIVDTNNAETVTACSSCAPETVCDDLTDCEICSEEEPIEASTVINPTESIISTETATEPFDYFCDFDEPDMTEKPLTDADLYPQQDPQKSI